MTLEERANAIIMGLRGDRIPESLLARHEYWMEREVQLLATLQAVRAEALAEAVRACEDEHLEDPNPNSEGDAIYTSAVDDCASAVRALAAGVPGEGVERTGAPETTEPLGDHDEH